METANLYSDLEFSDHKPAIRVLFKTEFTKEIRILMRGGQVMKEHKTSFPIVVEVCDGSLDFGVGGQVLKLVRGDLIALEASVPHDLCALEDCIVRLTLTVSDNVSRVKKVLD